MTETEYLQQAQSLFHAIIDEIETRFPDWDANQSGAVLEIENEQGQKIIINQQTPLREIWLASRIGGYHFQWRDGQWVNGRDGGVFRDYLDAAIAIL